MGFFTGQKEKMQQVPTKTAGQQDLLSQILGNLGQGGLGGQGYEAAIQNLLGILSGSPEAFQAFEAPAKRQFQEETIPNILERFSGAGARSSSGVQQALGGAGRQLEENLSAQRAGLQQNAVQQLLSNFMGQGQLGLGTQTFENILRPAQPGFLQSLMGGLGQGLGGAAQTGGQFGMLKMLGIL